MCIVSGRQTPWAVLELKLELDGWWAAETKLASCQCLFRNHLVSVFTDDASTVVWAWRGQKKANTIAYSVIYIQNDKIIHSKNAHVEMWSLKIVWKVIKLHFKNYITCGTYNRHVGTARETVPPRNDLYCVGWGVKLYSLTHSLVSV